MMTIAKVMGTASLLVLFGVAVPSHAQEPKDQQDAPKEQPKDKEQPKERPKNPKDQPDKPKEQPRPENRNDAATRDEHAKQEQGHEQAQHEQAQHGQGQRGRIPDEKFKASFGREHTFHVGHPEIVGGQPHFSYGGYSFVIGQAWPAGWAYTDNVYIVDINGVYYLVDLDHPGPQIALTVVL